MTNKPQPSAAAQVAPHAADVLTEEIAAPAGAPLPNAAALGPAATGLAPLPVGDGVTLAIDPREEYVAAGSYSSSMLAYARSLPDYIDDTTRDFGADLYERMGYDSQIAGDTATFKSSVLANGVQLLPAYPAPSRGDTDADAQRKHDLSNQMMAFCQRGLDEMGTPLYDVLYDLLSAFGLGNRCAELVYRWDTDAKGARILLPDRISVKPRSALGFVVDSRGRLLGLLGAIAGQAEIMVRPGLIVSPKETPNLLPRSKFAVLSWEPRHGDPRGTSEYRPAYDPWWQKRQTEVELAKFITQFAGAMLIGTLGEKAQPVMRANLDGTPMLDGNGRPLMDTPAATMSNALINMRNGGVAVFPFGSDVKNLCTVGAGAPFFAQIERCNAAISKVLLGTALATNDSAHESRAATTSHKDVMDLKIERGETALSEMLRRDVLREMVRLNFGDAYVQFTPKVSLGAVEEADLGELSQGLSQIGYTLAPSQLPAVDAKMGLPARTDEEIAQATEAAANAAQPVIQVAPDGQNPPTGGPQKKVADSLGNNSRRDDNSAEPTKGGKPAPNDKSDADHKFTQRLKRAVRVLFSDEFFDELTPRKKKAR